MSYQRYINDDQGNQVEIDPTTLQPTVGQEPQAQPSELAEFAELRPVDPDWVKSAEEWAEDQTTGQS